MADIHFVSNLISVKQQIEDNKNRALTAIGLQAVSMIIDKMQSGYGKPIWQTGDLQRDVHAGKPQGDYIRVGNSLKYAPFVHDGTYKMKGRPYIEDAVNGGMDKLKEVAGFYLKQGF